eukprot:Polyplicarium_translucidae@DN1556_c0_g1_i1.p1
MSSNCFLLSQDSLAGPETPFQSLLGVESLCTDQSDELAPPHDSMAIATEVQALLSSMCPRGAVPGRGTGSYVSNGSIRHHPKLEHEEESLSEMQVAREKALRAMQRFNAKLENLVRNTRGPSLADGMPSVGYHSAAHCTHPVVAPPSTMRLMHSPPPTDADRVPYYSSLLPTTAAPHTFSVTPETPFIMRPIPPACPKSSPSAPPTRTSPEGMTTGSCTPTEGNPIGLMAVCSTPVIGPPEPHTAPFGGALSPSPSTPLPCMNYPPSASPASADPFGSGVCFSEPPHSGPFFAVACGSELPPAPQQHEVSNDKHWGHPTPSHIAPHLADLYEPTYSPGTHDAQLSPFLPEDDLSISEWSKGNLRRGPMQRKPFLQHEKYFPEMAKDILREWLVNHMAYPYPDKQDKEELCRQTGLNLKQLNNWFTNTRKRHWKRFISSLQHGGPGPLPPPFPPPQFPNGPPMDASWWEPAGCPPPKRPRIWDSPTQTASTTAV